MKIKLSMSVILILSVIFVQYYVADYYDEFPYIDTVYTETDILIKEALTLYEIGLLKESKLNLENAIYRQPHYSLSHFLLGEVNSELGKKEKAIIEYRKAILLDPESYRSRLSLSLILFSKGEVDSSILYIREAIEINPVEQDAYILLNKFSNEIDKIIEDQ